MAINNAAFTCPSCAAKLATIEIGSATQVVFRTCRKCGDRWRVVASPVSETEGMRLDKGEFFFIDNRHTRKAREQGQLFFHQTLKNRLT